MRFNIGWMLVSLSACTFFLPSSSILAQRTPDQPKVVNDRLVVRGGDRGDVIQFLTADDVREELNLDEKQHLSLQELAKRYQERMAEQREEGDRVTVRRQVEAEAENLLSEEQQSRYREIRYQDMGYEIFFDPYVVEELNFTNAQIQALAQIRRELADRLERLLEPGPDGEVPARLMSSTLAQYRQRAFERMMFVLNEGQQVEMRTLLGAPFERNRPLPNRMRPVPGEDASPNVKGTLERIEEEEAETRDPDTPLGTPRKAD
ncbi:Hypothetical protein PBC10988_27880 [Planctomycetales bacterium 10988]|nr:Hypothetical protein PBC10988_27880 [Planctomycetales bacterium 10988]